MKEQKSFSVGNFLLPMNSMCSKKWATPCTDHGSLKLPTPTHNPRAACNYNKFYILAGLYKYHKTYTVMFSAAYDEQQLYNLIAYV
jgi:hypothetical protein